MQAADTLVVFYSRSGMTRRVAQAFAQVIGADIQELRDTTNRGGLIGYLRSGMEATVGSLPAIAPLPVDPGAYRRVIVGTPVWNASVSSPVRSFLVSQGPRCKEVAFFCTFGGSGSDRVFRQMAKACGKQPIATLAIRDEEMGGSAPAQRISELAERLGVSQPGVSSMRASPAAAAHRGVTDHP